MKKLASVVVVVAASCLPGCHKGPKPVKTPAPPSTTAETVPSIPEPAPAPGETGRVNVVPDDYARIRDMSLDEINRTVVPSMFPDIHFDFDRSEIKDSEKPLLNQSADNLKRLDYLKMTIEGHADERGTAEYNLALSERRARAILDYLVGAGVAGARLKTIGYGKEVPLCTESNEGCWSRNRRGHFTATGKTQ
jgi:peptidoglycan-associated lipoprotein